MVRDGEWSERFGDKVPDFSFDKPEPIIKPKTERGLPCPDPVDALPLSNPAPSRGDVVWMNVQRAQGSVRKYAWNAARHFIILGGGAALASVTGGASLAVAGKAFLVGGAVGMARKIIDLKRVAAGKPDMLTAAKNRVTRTRGDGMGTRTEVYEVVIELVKVGDILMDDVPNSQQLSEGMAAVLGVIKEGSDFRSIPKQERAKAIGHAFVMAGAEIYDKGVTYSDEVEV